MDHYKIGIMAWNQLTFRNIFQHKQKCKARLLGVQRALTSQPKRSLLKLETKLLAEFDGILHQEESYWRQKAGANWVCHGERNTRFFHAIVVARRRRTQVHQLKLADGSWCMDGIGLQALAYDFYKNLYSKDHSCGSFLSCPKVPFAG